MDTHDQEDVKFKASRRSQKDVLNIKFEFKPPRVRQQRASSWKIVRQDQRWLRMGAHYQEEAKAKIRANTAYLEAFSQTGTSDKWFKPIISCLFTPFPPVCSVLKNSQLNHTGCSDTFGGHLTLCLLKRAVVIISTSSFQLGLNSILVLKDDGSPSVPTYRVVFYSSPLTLIHILLERRVSHKNNKKVVLAEQTSFWKTAQAQRE